MSGTKKETTNKKDGKVKNMTEIQIKTVNKEETGRMKKRGTHLQHPRKKEAKIKFCEHPTMDVICLKHMTF